MERAFKIKVGSNLHNDWEFYRDSRKQEKDFINEFFSAYGIESNPYKVIGDGFCNRPYPEDSKHKIQLGIDPTENDLVQFGGQLKKPNNYGVSYFKKNSKVLKDFQNQCVEKEIIINIMQPDMRDYFNSIRYTNGYARYIFKKDDVWFLKVSSETLTQDDTPEDVEEIKLSEFYMAEEELDKLDKKGER